MCTVPERYANVKSMHQTAVPRVKSTGINKRGAMIGIGVL